MLTAWRHLLLALAVQGKFDLSQGKSMCRVGSLSSFKLSDEQGSHLFVIARNSEGLVTQS